MNILLNLKRTISADILKYKNTKAMVLAVGAPLLLVGIYFLAFFFKADKIVKEGTNGWETYFSYLIGLGLFFLYPLFLILLTALIHFIEHSANTWKQVYATSADRFSIYFSKVFMSLSFSFIAIVLFYLFTIGTGFLIELKYPDLFTFEASYAKIFLLINLKVFIACMAMSALQFWIAFKWKNIVVPFGVGIIGFVAAIILVNGWKYVKYYPYAFAYQIPHSVKPEGFEFWQLQVILGLGLAAFFYIAGYIELRTRKVLE